MPRRKKRKKQPRDWSRELALATTQMQHNAAEMFGERYKPPREKRRHRPIKPPLFCFGEHFGKTADKVPLDYIDWFLSRKPNKGQGRFYKQLRGWRARERQRA